MDISSKGKYPAKSLSNFACHPFEFRGIKVNSMEGLLQGLKFSSPAMQAEVCTLVGFAAKKKGRGKNWHKDQTIYWQGEAIKRDSQEYQDLLDEAYNCMFTQSEKARKALRETQDANLTHSIGKRKKSETVLTEQEFCSRLIKIRRKLQNDVIFTELFK